MIQTPPPSPLDLVFYNYLLKCFVLLDLKTRKVAHSDIGQMDMYVRLFDDLKRGPDDNPTLGIILCTDKDDTPVRYSVLSESQQLPASKYRLVLPSEEELRDELKRRHILQLPGSGNSPNACNRSLQTKNPKSTILNRQSTPLPLITSSNPPSSLPPRFLTLFFQT